MEKYRGVIEAALNLAAEYAKTTAETWDDTAVSVARTVLLAFFGEAREPMAAVVGDEKAISPTTLVLILTVLRFLWSLRK